MTSPKLGFSNSTRFRLRFAAVSVALAATLIACSSSTPSADPATAGSPGASGGTNSAGASNGSSGSAGAVISAGAGGAVGSDAGAGGSAIGGAPSGGDGTGGAGASSAGAAGEATSYAEDVAFCSAALDSAAADFKGFIAAYPNDGSKIPRSVNGTTVKTVALGDWTGGFDAGSMWLLYEHTKDQAYRTAAEAWTTTLYNQRLRTDDHDVGFITMTSYGNGYRITKNPDYAAVIKTAGQSLSTRFNAKVGCTKSWNGNTWSYPVIIDNMMNLELLYRATELGGSADLAADAKQHALTTLTNHFRPDFSSYHLVDYNPSTGAVIKKQTVQGIADDSAWARGQAWGLYGFTELQTVNVARS